VEDGVCPGISYIARHLCFTASEQKQGKDDILRGSLRLISILAFVQRGISMTMLMMFFSLPSG
jgi:hypothetical protein